MNHVRLVCLCDEVAACNCTVARDNAARQSPTESRDKIAGVTSLLYNNNFMEARRSKTVLE